MQITLDAMEVLDAIDREGGFSAAARRLHRAQSAVSYAVRQLEDALGVQLFDRDGWRAQWTPAGRLVLAEARAVLTAAGRLTALASALDVGWEPRLAIVVDAVLPLQPLLRAIATLDQEGAPTAVEIISATLGGVERRFDEIDADLLLTKELSSRGDLRRVPLAPVEMWLVTAPGHALAHRVAVDRGELSSHREILVYDSGVPMPEPSRHAIGAGRRFLLGDFATKREALLLGLGVGWLPMPQVADDVAAGRLVRVDLIEGGSFAFTPVLAHRADRPLGRAGRRLFELLAPQGSLASAAAVVSADAFPPSPSPATLAARPATPRGAKR